MRNDKPAAIEYKEGQRLLFEGSARAIYFNVLMAALLSASLLYNNVPKTIVYNWLAAITVVCGLRMIHIGVVLKKGLLENSAKFHIRVFLILTTLMGATWAILYFIALPYSSTMELSLIILFYGGMTAGCTGSLGVYPSAFFGYVFAELLPVIVYKFCFWNVNSIIFGLMIAFFILAISIIAKTHQRMLGRIFFLKEQNEELKQKFEMLSITDSLTNLFNRRHFNETIQQEYNRARRNQQSIALVMIDVDNFKLINDNLGHPFGDLFLKYLSTYLKNHLKRENDLIFRLGGDEFAVLLLNTNEENARQMCNKLKTDFFLSPPFEYCPKDEVHESVMSKVSLSIGVIYVPYESKSTIEQIIEQTDKALYEAKNGGKNQITFIYDQTSSN